MSRGEEGSGHSPATEVIVDRFRNGDAAATRRVRARVSRILAFRGYGIPPDDRLDLEQSVMTQLWQAVERSGFEPVGFWGLVEVVSSRRCIDWRRARREERALDEIGEPGAADPDSLARLLRREKWAQARSVLRQLPAPCRELIRLQAGEGKTYRQIAEILGGSEGALRVQMYRCIQRARRLLEEDDER